MASQAMVRMGILRRFSPIVRVWAAASPGAAAECDDDHASSIGDRRASRGSASRGHGGLARTTHEEHDMDRKLIIGIAIGAALASAGAVIASRGVFAPPEFAEVVRVAPEMALVPVEREQCRDVVRQRTVARDDNLDNGTVIGALVGGAIGNQVGGGRGRDAATVAGVVAGGYAGREIDRNHRKTRVVDETHRECRTVTEQQEQQVGFRVTYRLDDTRRTVLMDRDPGDQVRLADVASLPEAPARR
jgi:uncharacterized protein YcfJ